MAVRGWVDPRKDCQWKISMIPSGIESATFGIVARGWVDPRKDCQWKIPMIPSGIESATFRIVARAWVDPRKDCQWKISMIPSGIESATFKIVARCLNQLRHRIAPTMMEGRWNAQHNIIQLETELFCIHLPDSLSILSSKNLNANKAFHKSSVALQNMLIWTKKLENAYIRLRQNYTDLPKIAPNQWVSEERGNSDENIRVCQA